jgi:hypothetical protein
MPDTPLETPASRWLLEVIARDREGSSQNERTLVNTNATRQTDLSFASAVGGSVMHRHASQALGRPGPTPGVRLPNDGT